MAMLDRTRLILPRAIALGFRAAAALVFGTVGVVLEKAGIRQGSIVAGMGVAMVVLLLAYLGVQRSYRRVVDDRENPPQTVEKDEQPKGSGAEKKRAAARGAHG